jgi:hypothetical protein
MNARDDLIDEYGRADTAPLGTLSDLRQKLNAYRDEVLAEVDKALAGMELPEHQRGTFNAGSYADAWRHCRDVVQGLAASALGVSAEDTPSPVFNADTARRAHLLTAITQGGQWKSGTVVRWYKANGYTGLGNRAARHDLAILRGTGSLVQHDEKGVRYFTAARSGGGRG